ncbi:hypothetical protein NLY34_31820 [Mesorhizobium sp. C374B]|nr:hypothetical protein [Mesorhizobium sp. C374B]WJI81188.1 hypothetical protein NLY34_31820 [Mesorhizobium sp. C374B]
MVDLAFSVRDPWRRGLLASFPKRDDVINGSFFLPLSISNWPTFLWFAVGASFLWLTVYQFYKVSFGLSLRVFL